MPRTPVSAVKRNIGSISGCSKETGSRRRRTRTSSEAKAQHQQPWKKCDNFVSPSGCTVASQPRSIVPRNLLRTNAPRLPPVSCTLVTGFWSTSNCTARIPCTRRKNGVTPQVDRFYTGKNCSAGICTSDDRLSYARSSSGRVGTWAPKD